MKRVLLLLLVAILSFALSSCTQPKSSPVSTSSHRANNQSAADEASWEEVVRAAELVAYYQDEYPMVWGYIKKNADAPYDYIEFYHDVWGDMQAYTGDGINFDTLTRYEQSLVNYPRIGSYVYFSSSRSKEYHSTSMCYSLLKSDPISKPASQRHNYNPCSKCVGN